MPILFCRNHKPIIRVPRRNTENSRSRTTTDSKKTQETNNLDNVRTDDATATIDIAAQTCQFSNKTNTTQDSNVSYNLVDTSTTKAQVHFVDPNHPIDTGARPKKTILKPDACTNLKPVRSAPLVPEIDNASAEMSAAIEAATALALSNPFKRAGSFRYQGFTPPKNLLGSFTSLPGIPSSYAQPNFLHNQNYEMTPLKKIPAIPPPSSEVPIRLFGKAPVASASASAESIEIPRPMQSFDHSKFARANTNGLPEMKTPLYRARSRDSIDPALANLLEMQLALDESSAEEEETTH